MRAENTLQFIERQIDEGLDRLLSHETFLRSTALLVNFNSYRRKWTRSAMVKVLSALEMPVKSDHERMMALLQQLNERLEDLEHRRSVRRASGPVTTAAPAAHEAGEGTLNVKPMKAAKGGKRSRAGEERHVGS
jgi:hypothetical protein